MNVRRALVILSFAVVAAAAVAMPNAGAAPAATFSSPTNAVAGAPMWIKSITPCPGTPADHIQFVTAWVVPQEDPNGEPLASVYGDLANDGSWRVTVSAPDGTPSGATASYFVRAICVVRDPYPSSSAATDEISQEYAIRSLLVTSSGGEGSGGGPGIPGTTTTTTSTTTTSTTTTSTTTTTVAAAGLKTSTFPPSYTTSGYQPRLDGGDASVSLNAQPASESRRDDSGTSSNGSGYLVFFALLAGLGAGGWQLSRFTKR